MATIVIVEDDKAISEELQIVLHKAGYQACCLQLSGQPEKEMLELEPDLVLLDVNLPGMSGLTVCDRLRAVSDVPVIFVTSNNTSMDELNCILRGGDDYVSKPYERPVLMARIGALLRRGGRTRGETLRLTHRGLTLDVPAATAVCGGRTASLTKNELKILYYLFTHRGKVVSRADLIEYLWDNEIFIDDNSLSVNMTRLRAKLTAIGAGNFIVTRRSLGWQIGTED